MVELKIADASSFAFETDLPPSSRAIHPSGILHAFRSTQLINGIQRREEHTFAWIEDLLHVEAALSHLQMNGFDVENGAAFIPYSTKSNWVERYPHASPALECNADGEIVVMLNWRPYPNGLGELGQKTGQTCAKTAVPVDLTEGEQKNWKRNATDDRNILRDRKYIPNAERNELHLAIYSYLSWFHKKLEGLKRSVSPKQRQVDVDELGGVVEKLESAFYIVPNQAEQANEHGEHPGEKERAPFLEEALADKLAALAARKMDGKSMLGEHASGKKPQKPFAGWHLFRSENKHSTSTLASEAWKALTDAQRGEYRRRAGELAQMEQGADDWSEAEDDNADGRQSTAATPTNQKRAIDQAAQSGPTIDRSLKKQKRAGDQSSRNGPTIDRSAGAFRSIVKKLERYKEEQGDCLTADELGALQGLGQKGLGGMYNLFEHPDGKNRRSPPGFSYHGVKIRQMYITWHVGDTERKMCPVKMWDKDDIRSLPIKRARISFHEMGRVMALIDQSAAANGVAPTNFMTRASANACFDAGKVGLNTPLTSPSGRPRNFEKLSWSTFTTYSRNLEKPAACAAKTAAAGAEMTAAEIEKQQSVYFRTVGIKQESSGSWRVTMSFRGKSTTVGTYKTQEQAVRINEVVFTKLNQKTYSKQNEEEYRRDLAAAREAAERATGCQRRTQAEWYNRGKGQWKEEKTELYCNSSLRNLCRCF